MHCIAAGILWAACGFLAGFAATRGKMQKDGSMRFSPPKLPANAVAVLQPADSSRLAKEAVSSLLALADKPRDHANDHAFCVTLDAMGAEALRQSAPQMVAMLRKLAKEQRFAGQVGEAWMQRWLEVDAPGALEFLSAARLFDALDPKDDWQGFGGFGLPFLGVFTAVARKDPEWTRAYLARLEPNAQRNCGVHHLAIVAGTLGPPRSQQLIAEFLTGTNRAAALEGFVKGLAERDPGEALNLAMAEPKGPLRGKLIDHLLWHASIAGTDAVRALIERAKDPRERAHIAGRAIGNIAYRTRAHVLPWLKEEIERDTSATSGSDFRQRWDWALQCVFDAGDHRASADWALTLKGDPEQNALARLTHQWGSTEPDELRRWLSENAERLDADAVTRISGALQPFARKDPKAAWDRAGSLPPGPLRDAMRFQAALAQARGGNAEHARAAYESVAHEDKTGEMAKKMAAILADQDRPAAVHWAMNLPPGNARAAAVRTIMENWTWRNPAGVAQWITDLPAGSDRDVVVEEFAANVIQSDPPTAAEWVLEIAGEKARENAASRVYWKWRMESPGAAAAWVKTLPGVSERWRRKTLSWR
jgi:hypothetical protein